MDHFQFKVGTATVHVHQAFMFGESPSIRIESGGEEQTLVIDQKGSPGPIEIKVETTD